MITIIVITTQSINQRCSEVVNCAPAYDCINSNGSLRVSIFLLSVLVRKTRHYIIYVGFVFYVVGAGKDKKPVCFEGTLVTPPVTVDFSVDDNEEFL